jgi:Family of unknown function (DUF5317)
MALALPLLAGLAISPLLGGRWSQLARLEVKRLPLFYVGIALQIAAFPIHVLPWRTPDQPAVTLWLASYALFATGAAANLKIPGVPLVLIGMLSNLAAIVANGGHMPALPAALRGAGLHFAQSRNSTLMNHPNLPWIVDRWAVPHWVPWGNVFSIGDVLIAAGGFILAVAATRLSPAPRHAAVDPASPQTVQAAP